MRKLLPLLLALVGMAGGVGAALFLGAAPDKTTGAQTAEECIAVEHEAQPAAPSTREANGKRDYVKLNNQFVVPLLTERKVHAMVVMSLSVEVVQGGTEAVYGREPKLRDLFLQVLFDHANMGGFDGPFTRSETLAILRDALRDAAEAVLPGTVTDVLITEIARQEV